MSRWSVNVDKKKLIIPLTSLLSNMKHLVLSTFFFSFFFKVRQDELPELEQLKDGCNFAVKGGTENEYGKVNILLQSYISKTFVDSFSLVSDMSYVAQVRYTA